MFDAMFDNSTLPMLEQVVGFTRARHGVLAGNVANLDTPGYRSRDLSPTVFEDRLKDAIEEQHEAAERPATPSPYMDEPAPEPRDIASDFARVTTTRAWNCR
jgi:flagellar basal-body rod protein FlgB